MPKTVNVEGVGPLNFPDDATEDQILETINRDYGKGKEPSALESVATHTAAGVLPSAGFMAAAVPGAEAGAALGTAVAPAFGPFAPAAPVVGGAIGGMITGIPGSKIVHRGQKELLNLIDPGWGEELEQTMRKQEAAHPYYSGLGDVLSMGPSARTLPETGFKLAQLPLRLALGAGMGAGMPIVTEGRLPTMPELVTGTAMGTLFGEARGIGEAGVRPRLSPEVRAEREAIIRQRGADQFGRDIVMTEEELQKKHHIANAVPGTNKVRMNRANLHHYLEQELADNVPFDQAVDDLLLHETAHEYGPRESDNPNNAVTWWKNLSPYERYLERRRIEGPMYYKRKRSDFEYGSESMRFWYQLAKTKSASELINFTKQENRMSRFLTHLQKAVSWSREHLGGDSEAVQQNRRILEEFGNKIDTAIEGAKDALESQTAQTVRDVREEPTREQQMPQAKRRKADDERGGQEGLEGQAQVPLKDRVKAQHKVIVGLHPGEAILESAVMTGGGTMGRGQPVYGSNHPDILDKIDPSGKLRKQFESRESRDTRDFGYRTNLRPFVSRMDLKVRKTGKPPHSDDLASIAEGGKKVGDQKDRGLPDWVREAMIRAGLDPKRPLNDVDLQNPSVREAIQNDPTLTPKQKAQILKTGSAKAPPAAPTVGAPPPAQAKGKAVATGVAAPVAGPAKATISTPAGEGKLAELESVKRQYMDLMVSGKAYTPENVDVMRQLAEKQFQLEEALGLTPKAQAMASKGEGAPGKPEEIKAVDVYATLLNIVRNKVLQEDKSKLVKDLGTQILRLPKAQWHKALTDVKLEYDRKELSIAEKELIASQQKEARMRQRAAEAGIKIDPEALTAEEIRRLHPNFDRTSMRRRLVYALSQPARVTGVDKSSGKTKYEAPGLWHNWWRDLHEQRPEIPEWAARDEYNTGVNNFLAYAPADIIKELLKESGGERRFLKPYEYVEGGKKTIVTRYLPDPDLSFVIKDMAFAPSPENSIEFKKFLMARNMTVEQGMAAIKQFNDYVAKLVDERMAVGEPTPGARKIKEGRNWRKVSNEEFEAYLKSKGKAPGERPPPGYLRTKEGFLVPEAGREEMSQRDIDQQREDFRKSTIEGFKLRDAAVDYLRQYFHKDALPPEKHPNRTDVGLGDIWFETTEPVGAYGEFGPELGENTKYLEETLGQGASMNRRTVSKYSRGIAVLINKITGDTHEVSVYRDPTKKVAYIYNPEGIPGTKNKGFYTVNKVLNMGYRVKAYYLVRDPLYRFHRKWFNQEGGPTGEEQFDAKIGNDARDQENSNLERQMLFQKRQAEAREAQLRAEHEERYYPKAEIEKEIGKEPTDAKGKQRWAKERRLYIEEREKEAEAKIRAEKEGKEPEEQEGELDPGKLKAEPEAMAAAREEEGKRPWEIAEDFSMARGMGKDPMDLASIQQWLAGPGKGDLGMFGTDPSRMNRGPLTDIEAASIYEIMRENKIENLKDIDDKITGRFQADRRIKASGGKKTKETFMIRGKEFCFNSGLEKIARKLYHQWVSGTGKYESVDIATGKPYARGMRAQELYSRYERLPKDFYQRFAELKTPADKEKYLMDELTPGQRQRYILEESRKVIAVDEAKREILADYLLARERAPAGERAEEGTHGNLALHPDTEYFRERATGKFGDTLIPDVRESAVRQTVSRQYAGRPVPRELGRAPKPGREVPYRRLIQWGQGPNVPVKGRPFPPAPTPQLTAKQAQFVRQQPVEATPRFPSVLYRQLAQRSWARPEIGRRGATGVEPPLTPRELPPGAGRTEPFRKGEKIPEMQKLAMTSKGYGAAEVYQEEMRAAGRIPDRAEKGEEALMSKADQIAKGRTVVLNGQINPVKEMIQFIRGIEQGGDIGAGYLSLNSMAAFRYHGYKMQQLSDQAIATKPRNSPEAKSAWDRNEQWIKDFDKAKEVWARMGHDLQGWNQIGPDDMRSTTFVRRALARIKGVEDLSPEDAQLAREMAEDVDETAGAADESISEMTRQVSKEALPKLTATEQQLVASIDEQRRVIRETAGDVLRRTKPERPTDIGAMAMKGEGPKEELPPLDPEQERALSNVGFDVMAELSKQGNMTDNKWLEEMTRILREEYDRADLEKYLPHIRALSEEIREAFFNNIIGTGEAAKDVREVFSRKRPTIDESITMVRRALIADPKATKITPMEAYHLWNYLRYRFFENKGWNRDFRDLRTKASAELGIKDDLLKITTKPYPEMRLFRAMSAKRSMREISEDVIKKVREETRMRSMATNWLKNQQYPRWWRVLRALPRFFFLDKVMGHGLVPMITHASNMMFNPYSWSVYFGRPEWAAKLTGKPVVRGAWEEMYRMFANKDYWKSRMNDIMTHERFEKWKSAGLEVDPFKFSDDYLIEGIRDMFEEDRPAGRALQKIGIRGVGDKLASFVGGRGFDALKTLRYARAEQWYNSLPEHLQNKESMRLISDSVNHATGIVKANFGEAGNWLLFAPKLEASRWAWLFKDTIKAADFARRDIFHHDLSLEQRAWYRSELKQKAAVLMMYYGTLAMNKAFLNMIGSDQDINLTDPRKSDFMQFKAGGFKIGVLSPMIGIFRLFANLHHDTMGERTKFERLTTRERATWEDFGQYIRGKASPILAITSDLATAKAGYPRRPLGFMPQAEPVTRHERLAGLEPYTAGEYFSESLTPIPLEEAVRTWRSMGADHESISRLTHSIVIGGIMLGTGARISEDVKK